MTQKLLRKIACLIIPTPLLVNKAFLQAFATNLEIHQQLTFHRRSKKTKTGILKLSFNKI
jgi:hypothetical protein